MSGHPLPACWASAAFRLRQTTLTCSYAEKVTIYNCRNLDSLSLAVSRYPSIVRPESDPRNTCQKRPPASACQYTKMVASLRLSAEPMASVRPGHARDPGRQRVQVPTASVHQMATLLHKGKLGLSTICSRSRAATSGDTDYLLITDGDRPADSRTRDRRAGAPADGPHFSSDKS